MNSALMNLVGEFPATTTPQEVFSGLSAKDQTTVDPEKRDIAHLLKVFGREAARQILKKLSTAGSADPLLRAGLSRLESEGLNFANSDVQAMLGELVTAGVLTAQEGTALKEIGVRKTSRLDRADLSNVVLADVVQAREDVQYRKEVLQPLVDLYNACIPLAEAGELTAEIWNSHATKVASGLKNWG